MSALERYVGLYILYPAVPILLWGVSSVSNSFNPHLFNFVIKHTLFLPPSYLAGVIECQSLSMT